MVGQEGAAEQPAQERLETYPFHKAVKIFVSCLEADGHLILPVRFCLRQRVCRLFFRVVFLADFLYAAFLIFYAKQDNISSLITGKEGKVLETERTHGFPSLGSGRGRNAGAFFTDGAGMGEGAALADIFFHGGEKPFRALPLCGKTADIVGFMVDAVALLVKGHGGTDKDAVFRCFDAVQHGGHVAVVPDIIRASSVNGYGGVRRQGKLFV